MRGERFDPMNPASLGFGAHAASPSSSSSSSSGSYRLPPTMAGRSRGGSGARAAYGDYPNYPEGRPIFLPEAERFGNPPDLPSLLLQQRVIYISMPVGGRRLVTLRITLFDLTHTHMCSHSYLCMAWGPADELKLESLQYQNPI